ncbi:MAG: CBS domain-containing protein [Nitrospinae bacterium]|nr:CBS domain-containing protein [Nitrospinota bacterium]
MSNPLLVRHVMMSNFKKLEGVTKVYDALAMMKEEGINAVLIQPRNEKDVYGIMTLKDIARKVIGERRKLHETHVYEIMSKPVLSVQADMPVPYAARFLTNFDVSYATVMEDSAIVGLVSLNGMVNQWKD